MSRLKPSGGWQHGDACASSDAEMKMEPPHEETSRVLRNTCSLRLPSIALARRADSYRAASKLFPFWLPNKTDFEGATGKNVVA
jgi:hypothetical protein